MSILAKERLLAVPHVTDEQVIELRQLFLKKLETDGAPCEGGFHPADLKRIKDTDIWLTLFLQQQDLNMKQSLSMLWDTCKWRKEYGTNDISEQNIRMEYINKGIMYGHNRDKDGKVILFFIIRHLKRSENLDNADLLRIFVYWLERIYRQENFEPMSVLFDVCNSGLQNLHLEFTKNLINTLKYYYPNSVQYILVYDMPWVLNAAFKIVKQLIPPKTAKFLRFVNETTIQDYVDGDKLPIHLGGTDTYEFKFEPAKSMAERLYDENGNGIPAKILYAVDKTNWSDDGEPFSRSNDIRTSVKKVHFSTSSPLDSPLSELDTKGSIMNNRGEGAMLRIAPSDSICFTHLGKEFIGTVEIANVIKTPVTFKIKTTSPEKFRVRPSSGVINPGSSVSVNVVLQQEQLLTTLGRDKFLVMCMEMKPDMGRTLQDLAEIWKNTNANSANVEQHRLKCSLPTSISSEQLKNGSLMASAFEEPDNQLGSFTSSIAQLTETTSRLESQIKFNRVLQWIQLVAFLLISVLVIYILKVEMLSAPECFVKYPNRK